MKSKLTFLLLTLALLAAVAGPGAGSSTAASTLVVDDNNLCPGTTHNSIQTAVNAASTGDTIQVCAGTYLENVNIPATVSNLTPEGAQANQPYSGRTFGDASESTVNGTLAIEASGVTVNGLSLTKTAGDFGVFGIHIKATGHGATIANNIFDAIVNTTTTSTSPPARSGSRFTPPINRRLLSMGRITGGGARRGRPHPAILAAPAHKLARLLITARG